MKIVKFDIKNFKGVKHASVDVDGKYAGNVTTLIGLNESGKTTILEAISNFIAEDKDTANLVGTVQKRSELQDLIPKHRKAAFTDHVSIAAVIRLDDDDISALTHMFREECGMDLLNSSVIREITVEHVRIFEDSTFKSTTNFWQKIAFGLKAKRARNYKIYGGSGDSSKEEKDIWLKGIGLLRSRLPKIVYFPTLLFNFPDRIYLEGDDSETNSYYVKVIQDVLDSQGGGLTIEKHIMDRITRLRSTHSAVETFVAILLGSPERGQIDAVLQRVSNEMSRVIFGAWNEILGRNVRDKRVQIDWFPDAKKENATYLELSIVDGQSKFRLSERSLGFRWFFSFLLFTEFRKNRKGQGGTIFLFDEPAANLHSKAQMRLLDSFGRIAGGDTYIIYSTHSHYMVNPLWLDNAYIVENKAMDYDNDDDVDSFAVRDTNIKAIRYRTFVGGHPTKTTYFQPVLDALDVGFSPLMRSARGVIVEGKNDYYAFAFFAKKLISTLDFEIFPGNGAGHSGNIISLFRGWGTDFVVLLDDDVAGRRAKKKYNDEYYLSSAEVFTLGDIDEKFSGKEFEDLYAEDVRSKIRSHFSIEKIEKKHYALFFQEILSRRLEQSFPETEVVFEKVVKRMIDRFSAKAR